MRFLVTLFIFSLLSFELEACMCSIEDFNQEEYNLTQEIFIGTIVANSYDEEIDRNLLKFEIIKSYKGELKESAFFQTQNGKEQVSSCNFNGVIGQTFLLFISRKSKYFEVDYCTRKVQVSSMNSFILPEWFESFVDVSDGIQEAYYPDNTLKSKGPFRNGQAHGDWKFYSELGVLEKEGSYIDGKLEGTWTSYFPNGKVASIQNFKDNEYDGKQQYFHIRGHHFLSLEENYFNGMFDGKQEGWLPNGVKSFYSIYQEDSLISKNCFDYDGVLWDSQIYRIVWEYNDTIIGEYISDLEGSLRTRIWTNDMLTSVFWRRVPVYWQDNQGELQIQNGTGYYKTEHSEGSVVDSLKSGLWKEKDYLGFLEIKTYSRSILNGLYEKYSPTGVLIEKGQYSEGKKNGVWSFYYSNGNIKEEREFKPIYINGVVINTWSPSGREMVVNGKGIHYEYDNEGNLTSGIRFKYKSSGLTKILKWKPPH